MTDNAQDADNCNSLEFAVGAAEIGRPIGLNPRQASYALEKGQIKCARKIGARWIAHKPTLRREFGAA